ncbi:MAG TPA: NB-ARC domain-containing protein [Niabella sp.]|nr:NB-ARC domain-containing protein [Niabella sp.]
MIINNRRDAGYTTISRFEEAYRKFLEESLTSKYQNYLDNIPKGVFDKAKDRANTITWENSSDFFENIDFPDLKEISLYKDHYPEILKNFIDKEEFTTTMDELYLLRCKIAHIKGYFTSIDLDKLIELTSIISTALNFSEFNSLLHKIKTDPNSVIVKIPSDFVEDFLNTNGIINNIPIPDYDYEGGFVGRDDDRKKIIQLLNGEKFPVITITGSGGVGKTSLALKVIQDITENPSNRIFDAIIWSSAKETKLSELGIEDIEPSLKSYDELLDTIIDLFGFRDELTSSEIDEKEKLANSIIELSKKVLIVIDNLETITDQRIINFILDAPLKVKFLITSRKGIGQVERRHELKELKVKEAVYLFRQLAKDKQLPNLLNLPDDTIKNYVSKVSYYPLAIKWVIGQVARGKDINRIIDSIHTTDSDISKFCYEQIFATLSDNCKKILFTLSLLDSTPNSTVLEYVVELDDQAFDDTIEELILVSLVIPEQFQNEKKEISTRYSLLPLTRGYTRLQLNKDLDLREYLKNRINQVESTITTTEKAKKEYKHSLYNFGAKSDEEKVATIIAQTAFQKYQTGHYDSAVEDYKRAIKIAPSFAPVYRNWAIMEAYENHLTEAEQLMEKASKLDPTDPQIFLIWGNIYRKSGKHVEGHKKYVIANSLAPNDPIILNSFGQAKSWLGYYEDAEKLLLQALGTDFSSLKHEIICRTSLAENSINWGDSLVKDRNYFEAEKKYSSAIHHCMLALDSNARDAKIFNALNKANLRRGHLHFKTRNERKAIEALNAVCNSNAMSFKQGLYKLEALILLGEYYLHVENIRKLKEILRTIDYEFKNSQVIRHNNNFPERINKLKEYINPDNIKRGIITSINIERGFVIITEDETHKTYLGHKFKFNPSLDNLSLSLRNLPVTFNEAIQIVDNEEKRQAKNIRITTAITKLSFRPQDEK